MESKRVKKGGKKVMCLGREDVTGIMSDALKPIYSLLDDMKKKVEGLVTLAIKQTELEGQIVNLQEQGKTREKLEDELFNRLRVMEGMTEPRSSCAAIFNNLDKTQDTTVRALAAIDKQIKDRTWAILILLIGAFLSVMGGIFAGLVIYFIRSGGTSL